METNNLEKVETTSSPTGYPSNIIEATIGFNTFEEASEYASVHGGYPCYLDRADGWRYWHRGGAANKPLELSESDYPDSTTFVRPGDYDSQAECIEDWFTPYVDFTDVDTIGQKADNLESIWEAYTSLQPGQAIIVEDGWFREVINTTCMSWSYDSKYFTIGVVND